MKQFVFSTLLLLISLGVLAQSNSGSKEVNAVTGKEIPLDEITLKNGAVVAGRIGNIQGDKVGYRPANSLNSGPELFIKAAEIKKVKFGVTGQEIVMNASNGKTEKNGKRPVYRKFKVDVMAGYSHYLEEGIYNYGINYTIEPKYNILDNLAVGLKLEAVDFRLVYDDVTEDITSLSAALSTEYYLGKKVFRPFFGMSVGYYSFLSDYNSVYSDRVTESSDFGGGPKIGFQVGHFRFATEMNFTNENVFVCLKLGGTIGGGKRK